MTEKHAWTVAQADPNTMNLFQALAWLDANRGKELEVTKRKSTLGTFRARITTGRLEFTLGDAWEEWTPDLSLGDDYSATIPKRQLPTPPSGWEWSGADQDLRLREIIGTRSYMLIRDDDELIASKSVRDALGLLIAEYETRPR